MKPTIAEFRKKIYTYYRRFGRKLPWRDTVDPYRIVVSEIMLQQTQAERVIPKYLEFIKLFPDFPTLAAAPTAAVIKAWQGLGYNRRALALKKLAEIVVSEHNGKLPPSLVALDRLPGIGPATAASILAFAFNRPTVFIETNIRSVFIHFFFSEQSDIPDAALWPLIAASLDSRQPAKWYNALMDYGTMLKQTRPNPSRHSRHYARQSPFRGSRRQLRGAILRLVGTHGLISLPRLRRALQPLGFDMDVIRHTVKRLTSEGYLNRHKNELTLRTENQ